MNPCVTAALCLCRLSCPSCLRLDWSSSPRWACTFQTTWTPGFRRTPTCTMKVPLMLKLQLTEGRSSCPSLLLSRTLSFSAWGQWPTVFLCLSCVVITHLTPRSFWNAAPRCCLCHLVKQRWGHARWETGPTQLIASLCSVVWSSAQQCVTPILPLWIRHHVPL